MTWKDQRTRAAVLPLLGFALSACNDWPEGAEDAVEQGGCVAGCVTKELLVYERRHLHRLGGEMLEEAFPALEDWTFERHDFRGDLVDSDIDFDAWDRAFGDRPAFTYE
jgi:hypothetical protein